MCHRRGDWSRTSSRASESDDEREDERASWRTRARDRLATFVPVEEFDATDETAVRPAVEPEPETTTERGGADATEEDATDDEREEEPIPADD